MPTQIDIQTIQKRLTKNKDLNFIKEKSNGTLQNTRKHISKSYQSLPRLES